MFCFVFSILLVGALALLGRVEAKYPLPGVQTGVDPQTGARPARRNIVDLQNDVPAWSLYIQALIAMQQTPEDDLLSYFQIAGIHGRPYYAWDGYEQDPAAPLIGYCTHYDVLFTTWHRPYLALFEQILANHTQRIAKTYASPIFQAAADSLRIPYWDWAAIPTMPVVVTTDTVNINTPSGPQDVPNPLLTYKFQNFPLNSTWFPSDQDGPLSTKPNTIRSENANGALSISNLMKDTYSTFSQVTDFDAMSTGNIPGRSFEYSHNLVHQSVGSGRAPITIGHMGSFSYSAFDPIFWLHHTNVDRLFAMWEALRPDQFLAASTESGLASGTFTIPIDAPLTVDTILSPFTSGDGQTPHNPTQARFTKGFGYSYPEIQDWLPRTPAELTANVTAAINTLYNPNGTFGPPMTAPSRLKRGLPVGELREWFASLQALNTALNDRYIVAVSLKSDQVGQLLVTPPPASIYGPLKSTVNHVLDLNDALRSAGVDTEDVAAVVAKLKNGLSWIVSKGNGTIVPNEQVVGLKIGIYDDVVTLPGSITELPKYGNRTAHPEVTSGKAGGV